MSTFPSVARIQEISNLRHPFLNLSLDFKERWHCLFLRGWSPQRSPFYAKWSSSPSFPARNWTA